MTHIVIHVTATNRFCISDTSNSWYVSDPTVPTYRNYRKLSDPTHPICRNCRKLSVTIGFCRIPTVPTYRICRICRPSVCEFSAPDQPTDHPTVPKNPICRKLSDTVGYYRIPTVPTCRTIGNCLIRHSRYIGTVGQLLYAEKVLGLVTKYKTGLLQVIVGMRTPHSGPTDLQA